MRLAKALPAGLLDAGFASLATFAVGVIAARLLLPAELGVYSLFFSSFTMVAVISTQLLFVPVEVKALDQQGDDRLILVRQSMRLGSLGSLAAAPLVLVALVFLGADGKGGTIPLAVTSVAVAVISPIQDHLRRMLHLAGRSWSAAATSSMQLAACGFFLILLSSASVERQWVPLGGLTLANIASTALGFGLARRASRGGHDLLRIRPLIRSGKWLLVVGLTPALATFLTGGLIVQLAGTEALGFAEAARVVSQPLLVVALGFAAVLGPRAAEAGARLDANAGHRMSRFFVTLMVMVSGVFLVLFGFDWRGNVMAHLVPDAYAVTGLVATTIVANMVLSLVHPHRSQLVGGRMERALGRVETTVGLFQVGSAALAGLTGSFAKPLSILVTGTGRWFAYRRQLRRLYEAAGPGTVI